MTVEALRGSRASRRARRSARRTSSRSGSCRGSTTGPIEGTIAFIEKKFAQAARDRRGEHAAPSRPAGTTARRRRTSPSRTRSRRRSSTPGTYRQITGNTALSLRPRRRVQALRASRSSSAPTRSRRRPTILEELAQLQALRRAHVPGRGRDRRRRRGARRRLRRRARRDDLRGPGHRAQVRDGRARGHARAAAAHPRHPARRPVHGHADEARAGRPADGALRPELGVARSRRRRRRRRRGCFDAAIEAARIALKYRTPVFLLSDAYLANGSEPWLIPDVATLPDISTTFATAPNDGDRVPPVQARRRDARAARGRSRARRASSTGSAASRRRTGPATSPTTPRTTT